MPFSASSSGCPRSLQVATFPWVGCGSSTGRPVAPAVSKSLHSVWRFAPAQYRSGCPRSLQVATFTLADARAVRKVRLPPQSPSRYIRAWLRPAASICPVAPAVSKSLHSRPRRPPGAPPSGCPRSLQVATFDVVWITHSLLVRLPPQSPSRYIHLMRHAGQVVSPVAPAVSKSLHSPAPTGRHPGRSGCPRSLQVATFLRGQLLPDLWVRLPPQSPSRYIRAGGGCSRRGRPVAPAVSKSLHSSRTELFVRLELFCFRQRIDALVQGRSARTSLRRVPVSGRRSRLGASVARVPRSHRHHQRMVVVDTLPMPVRGRRLEVDGEPEVLVLRNDDVG